MNHLSNQSLVFILFGLMLCTGFAHAGPCQKNIPASNPDVVYKDHGNGTVTDTRTGLMWKQCAEGLSGAGCQAGTARTFTWTEALTQAELSTFSGYTDWRMPNVKELASLVEDCRVSPAINTILFPNTTSAWFWSGSPSVGIFEAWLVKFGSGSVDARFRNQRLHARFVRGG